MSKHILVFLIIIILLTACNANSNINSSIAESSESISSQISEDKQINISDESKSSSQSVSSDSSSEAPDIISPKESESSNAQDAISASSESDTDENLPDSNNVYIILSTNTLQLNDIIQVNSGHYQIPYTFYNDSSRDIITDFGYAIEFYSSQGWIELQFDSVHAPNWPLGNYTLETNDSVQGNLTYWDFENDMIPGKYRVKLGFFESSSELVTAIYSEFEVV